MSSDKTLHQNISVAGQTIRSHPGGLEMLPLSMTKRVRDELI
jgi:hypothetical protein